MDSDIFNLYCKYLVFCSKAFDDMQFNRLQDFCKSQWPIVERALLYGEGIRALNSRAHDLTCAFVERNLYSDLC